MTLDDVLFVLIGAGMALSAFDLFYRLHHQSRAKVPNTEPLSPSARTLAGRAGSRV
jgi:hypothetical protein